MKDKSDLQIAGFPRNICKYSLLIYNYYINNIMNGTAINIIWGIIVILSKIFNLEMFNYIIRESDYAR